MKKCKKTYAILNLAEKHTVFHLGKTKVHVSFTGGIVTKKGVTPATYTTDNPIVQLAIENSADFKRGAVKLQSSYPMQGEVKIGMNPPAEEKATAAATYTPKADLLRESATTVETQATAAKAAENPEPPAAENAAEAGQEEAPAEEQPKQESSEKTGELEVIETSCKDTAKAYLQDHFGENPAPLRTREDVQNCAAKYGITFNFV